MGRQRQDSFSDAQNKAAAEDNFAVKYYFSFISEQQTSADGSAVKSFKRYFPVQSFFHWKHYFFAYFAVWENCSGR